ncbi:equilibrative nucleoside transporter 1-like isoform X3 [Silurus meridionalis]|uniref:equilibrative nucleoside transporter 1-like isoform X3 n=1 Tax=Silurus meridionalis TaxID=175797 RepID=UPI001EEAFAFF|nr:equilibrative nucleoside transporter 1-like isoform X3 [Silurus meridionalis]
MHIFYLKLSGIKHNFFRKMAIQDPEDRFKAVWLIMLMLGLGSLLPWNFFMTAIMYFNQRLADAAPANATVTESRNALQAIFNNAMTLCAMITLLIFTCLNYIIHQRISQKIRILGSLVSILVVFCVTAIFVKLPIEPMPFFVITMIKIIIINAFGAILQGSLFGMAGVLPEGYMTPIMSGQGLAGTFASFALICAMASGSDLMDCAFGYFITACAVISLAILSYIILTKLEYYQNYQYRNIIKEKSQNGGNSERMSMSEEVHQNPSLLSIFSKPGKDSKILPALLFARLIFVALFMLCNVQPRHSIPVYFSHDAWFTIFIVLFAFSNGYLASLCMCFCLKLVNTHEAETAGAIMAFFITLGLTFGASFSFLFRGVI